MPKSRKPTSPSKGLPTDVRPKLTSSRSLGSKLPTLAPKLPSPKNSSSPSTTGSAPTRKSLQCAVCLQPGCQLLTHKAFGSALQPGDTLPRKQSKISPRPKDKAFVSSYAYGLGQQYVDRDIAASKVDPFYNLPVPSSFNTPEMHRLFHDWFTVEAQASFRIPRPPEMVGDLLYSPFFMPAMQDTALCLSILAISAATAPARVGQSPRNVVSLTLVGEAMQQMRERINADPENVTDITIVAATFLWAVNAWLEDTNAMKSHGSSVYAFVESRGGLAQLGMVGAVAQFIRWIDILNALIFSESCHFLDAVDPIPVVRSIPCRYGTFWLLPRTSEAATISADVVAACQEACALIALLEHAETRSVTATTHVYIFNKLCFLYARHSLLRVKHQQIVAIDSCVCLALSLIKIKCFYGGSQPPLLTTSNAVALIKAIKAAGGPSFWQKDIDILIWLLFVTVMLPEEFEDKGWCAELLCQAVAIKFGEDEAWPTDWRDRIQQSLSCFVWSDLRFADMFRDTCNNIAQVRGIDEDDYPGSSDTGEEGEDDMEIDVINNRELSGRGSKNKGVAR